ncbi:hypothetical protein JOL79_22490 [Microbispora sp. RL4-1S]|uniref:Uncharacterized protein n=1 Tax=Microbispora oryzae TaxID=2806554 RepID=A0A940WJ54_9ACTN|nr:hypothetical protein [Microbispora oryzae]MBP2706580.1 hypothetical protein [Microbispora oryzae]
MRDEYLLAALRLGAGSDPVPARVSAAARAAFALHLPGGIAAPPVEVPAPSGARSGAPGTDTGPDEGRDEGGDRDGGGPDELRLRRFTAAGLTIDVEITVTGGRLEVAGQVSPPPGPDARVEVRTPHIAKVRALTGGGHFAVAGLPAGWVSVVCHRPGEPPVFTRWAHVGA